MSCCLLLGPLLLLLLLLLGPLGALGALATPLTASSSSLASSLPPTLAPPSQVRFDSVDYKNILRWTPPTSSSSLTYYVQWKIYGEPQWLDVEGCQGVQRLHCDLSSVTSEPREWYYARVHASSPPSSQSAWALSRRFSPRWDTIISPPVLKLNITQEGIVVRVKSPKHIRKMHSDLQYKIYLTHPSGVEEVFEMEARFKKRTLRGLKHKVKYCLQAQTVIPQQAKTSTRGSAVCIHML